MILEAYSFGLPVICLDIGGPDKLVDQSCGFKITVGDKSADEVSSEIANLLLEINKNREILVPLREEAYKKADYYSWSNIVQRAYALIEKKIQFSE